MPFTHIASVRVNPERASAAPQPWTLTSGQPRADERLRPPARVHRLQLFATATSADFSFNPLPKKQSHTKTQNNIFWIILQFLADPICYYENTGLERMKEAEEADCSVFVSLTESPAFTFHMLAFTTTSRITSWRRVCAADGNSAEDLKHQTNNLPPLLSFFRKRKQKLYWK